MAGCSMPPTVSIDVLMFPVKAVPLSLIVQTFKLVSHSLSIAVTFGRTFVKV
jgi:hypothetical protein